MGTEPTPTSSPHDGWSLTLAHFFFRLGRGGKLVRIDSPDHAPELDAALGELDAARANLERNPTDVARSRLKQLRTRVESLRDAAAAPSRRAHLVVEVEINQVGTSLICGAVRVFSMPPDPRHSLKDSFEPGRPPESITAGLWRQVRIGELVDEAMRGAQSFAARFADRLPAEVLDLYRSVAEAEAATGRPGPKVRLTAELLRDVVIPAYLAGGRTPLQAVRQALAGHGYSGGHVTIDQARAAVRKAKTLIDLESPARRRGPNA